MTTKWIIGLAAVIGAALLFLGLPGRRAWPGLGWPRFGVSSGFESGGACMANLKQLEGAKSLWALEQRKTDDDTPLWDDLVGPDKYIRTQPACPAGGIYTLHPVAQAPRCSRETKTRHRLDPKRVKRFWIQVGGNRWSWPIGTEE